MARRFVRCAAAAIVTLGLAGTAAADPPTEQQIKSAIGAAIGKSFSDAAAGIAGCEDARALLTPGSPAWLGFYIEQCLATVSEPGGVMGGARCPHYQKQVEIWRSSPPPVAPGEEDTAISRVKAFRQARESLANYCTPGASPKPPESPDALVIPVTTKDATLQTQEGLTYTLPAGYGVSSFNPDSGLALLRDPAADLILRVERKGLNDRFTASSNYPDKETMPSGAVLQWEYQEFIPGSKHYVLYGRVTLPNAYVVLGISTGSKSGDKSVDKDTGLVLFRKIAGSVRITGPRCIGDCKPGVLKPS